MNELLIDGKWTPGNGAQFTSTDPATNKIVWSGNSAAIDDVNLGVKAARSAFESWALTPLDERISVLERYRDMVREDADNLARMISLENGKPYWEAKTEAAAVSGKVDISIRAYHERTGDVETLSGVTTGQLRHKPHGVMAILAPFNFPVHLANGHMVPALLAGNTIIVKPSELTPGPLAFLAEKLQQAGVPDGALNLLQGGREVGEALTQHPDVDGILFTGGARTGIALHRQFGGQIEKILALELGGNNPLIWWDVDDVEAAAFATVQSAFLTAGQRCTCARRLILPAGKKGDDSLEALAALTKKIQVAAAFDEPQPFMGPLISANAAKAMIDAFSARKAADGKSIVEMIRHNGDSAFVTPGIIEMTDTDKFPDEEHFGPMLQVWRARDFDEAIALANDTRFGLAAGLFSQTKENFEKFLALSRAGIVNWNRQTTGASGAAPFGGIGHSGNHNPSAYYAADYCAYPVASMEGEQLLPMPKDQIGIK